MISHNKHGITMVNVKKKKKCYHYVFVSVKKVIRVRLDLGFHDCHLD